MVVSSGTLSQENWKIPQLEPFCPAWLDHYWNIFAHIHPQLLLSRALTGRVQFWIGETENLSQKLNCVRNPDSGNP